MTNHTIANKAIFTFSPDGGQSFYTFSPSGRLASFMFAFLACMVVCIALALVELAHLVMNFFTFLLTANGDVLTRLGWFALFLVFMMMSLSVLQYLRLRSATASVGAPA